MRTEQYIDACKYPAPKLEPLPPHHAILCEIAARLQEIDRIVAGVGDDDFTHIESPAGVRIIKKLLGVYRASPRAYRLLIDLLSEQKSLAESLEVLASRHISSHGKQASRQAWHQNMQKDVKTLCEVWPEVGRELGRLMARRDMEGHK